MLASLQRLAALPPSTLIYCAHEYTLANLAFALEAEPDNPAIAARLQVVTSLRARGQPSLPTTLATELDTNPFLRLHAATVRAQALRFTSGEAGYAEYPEPLQTFVRLRAWKDRYLPPPSFGGAR
jgi:hydroxyacylglutathione hydrolase